MGFWAAYLGIEGGGVGVIPAPSVKQPTVAACASTGIVGLTLSHTGRSTLTVSPSGLTTVEID